MSKVISCGIIIRNQKKQILGCLPYGRKDGRHDLPKGKTEIGETYKQTVIREYFEETGLDISTIDLIEIGLNPYIKSKDLYLFQCNLEIEDLSKLVCTTFHNVYGVDKPEVVSYKWIDKEKITEEFFEPLVKVFKNIKLI